MTRARLHHQRGQVAILFALALVAIVAIVGLAIDGGQSYVDQRALQAGTDTSAQSGASMLQADFHACLAGSVRPYSQSDIEAAVTQIAQAAVAAHGTSTAPPAAYFVTYPALSTFVPISAYPGPFCLAGSWVGPTGVAVTTQNRHHTVLLQIVGIAYAKETARATAILDTIPGGAAAPYAVWYLHCPTSASLTLYEPVTLLSPSWDKSTCGSGAYSAPGPNSFKGYLDPTTPLTVGPSTPGCLITGTGTGVKSGFAAAPPAGSYVLVPTVKGVYASGSSPDPCPSPPGTYGIEYAGFVLVQVQPQTSTSTITGIVESTSPSLGGFQLCPARDTSCQGSLLSSTTPSTVELYQ